MTKTFSHSGTTGDVFNAMSVVKALGGGHLYLKLNHLAKAVREKLGWDIDPIHTGRMTQHDFDIMKEFILHQPYITGFTVWNGEHIDHDFDEMALHHETGVFPRNFPNQYAKSQGLNLEEYKTILQKLPYMECREPIKIQDRPFVIFRGERYQSGNDTLSKQWKEWIDWGLLDRSVFVGLPNDHQWFCKVFNVEVPHYQTPTFMDMARVMQGSEMVITSMSSPCAMGLALGKTMWIETRKNEPHNRLEVNYPYRMNVFYF